LIITCKWGPVPLVLMRKQKMYHRICMTSSITFGFWLQKARVRHLKVIPISSFKIEFASHRSLSIGATTMVWHS
jgi:hypothetical protein